MPIQQLEVNPGYDPDFRQPPPIVEPTPSAFETTQSKLCTSCEQFFVNARPRWTGHSTELHRAVVAKAETAEITEDDSSSTLSKKTAALECFNVQSIRDLCHSAKDQTCHLCIMVHGKLLENYQFGPILRDLEQQYSNGACASEYLVRMTVSGYYRQGTGLYVLVTDLKDEFVTTVSLHVFADAQAETQALGLLPYSTSTSSALSIALCMVWFQLCMKNHTECKPSLSDPSILPARLLDVSAFEPSGQFSLHETTPFHGPYSYLTLSHCWGKSDRRSLTQATLEDFKLGLPIRGLARTFRQAIEITHRLGFQYLWIDCLCIIQDSQNNEDWLRESSKMAGIYGRATCNIAASASPNTDGGCYRERSHFNLQPLRFEQYSLPLYEGESNAGPMFIAKHAMMEALDPCQGPLDGRGWILQEQLLAPRTIHFASDQVFWECRQLMASELWITGIPSDALNYRQHVRSKTLFDQTKLLLHEDSAGLAVGDGDLLHHRWYTIVNLYTRRALTEPKDKLPALSGIADIMKSLLQEDYLAGLWRGTLLHDLAWVVKAESRKPTGPTEYRAPSWSWASVDGVISWDVYSKQSDQDMQCSIHLAEVTLLNSSAATGEVKSGSLDITGLVRHTTWISNPDRPSEILLCDTASAGWLDEEIQLHPDVDAIASNLPSTILLVQLFRSYAVHKHGSPLGRYRLRGLILIPVDPVNDNNKLYRRVGFFLAANWGYTKIAIEGWDRFIDGWTSERLTIV